jgi:hypothetical protein
VLPCVAISPDDIDDKQDYKHSKVDPEPGVTKANLEYAKADLRYAKEN